MCTKIAFLELRQFYRTSTKKRYSADAFHKIHQVDLESLSKVIYRVIAKNQKRVFTNKIVLR